MLDAAEVVEATSHPVGGVCPFGLPAPLPVYCDVSLREFDEVVPAAGATNAAVRLCTAARCWPYRRRLGRCLQRLAKRLAGTRDRIGAIAAEFRLTRAGLSRYIATGPECSAAR